MMRIVEALMLLGLLASSPAATPGPASQAEKSEDQGINLLLKSRFEEAMPYLDMAILLDPTQAYFHANRGQGYYHLHQYEKSLADYDRAIQLQDKNPASDYYYRGRCHQALGRPQRAIQDFDAAQRLGLDDSTLSELFTNRGAAFYDQREYGKALADFNDAIVRDPKDPINYRNRAQTQRKLKSYQAALQDATLAIQLDGKSANAYLLRGDIYQDMKRPEQAVRDYTESLRLNPNNPGTYNSRGNAWRDMERESLALEDFNAAIRCDGKYRTAYLNRANIRAMAGDYAAAIADCNRAIELDATDPMGWGQRGVVRLLQSRDDEARADIRHAVELDDTYRSILADMSKWAMDKRAKMKQESAAATQPAKER